MADFIEKRIIGKFHAVPTGPGNCWMLTQDCAGLVLGYYPIYLREKDGGRFHLSRVGEDGGRLITSRRVLQPRRSFFAACSFKAPSCWGGSLWGRDAADQVSRTLRRRAKAAPME